MPLWLNTWWMFSSRLEKVPFNFSDIGSGQAAALSDPGIAESCSGHKGNAQKDIFFRDNFGGDFQVAKSGLHAEERAGFADEMGNVFYPGQSGLGFHQEKNEIGFGERVG